jgi:hypothetical protein
MFVATRIGVEKQFPSTSTVVAHLFYLQDLLGIQALSSVYWTLCLEVQFYLALILLLATRWPMTLALGLLGWSLLEHANIVSIAARGLFVQFWFGFAAGAFTYWTTVGRCRPYHLYMVLATILIFAIGKNGAWCLVTAITAAALHVASRIDRMGKWLSDSLMQGLGKISYSLYLFHPIVGWSTQSFALRYMNQWGALIAGLAASVLSAWIAYLVAERPAIRLSHWVALKPATGRGSETKSP